MTASRWEEGGWWDRVCLWEQANHVGADTHCWVEKGRGLLETLVEGRESASVASFHGGNGGHLWQLISSGRQESAENDTDTLGL